MATLIFSPSLVFVGINMAITPINPNISIRISGQLISEVIEAKRSISVSIVKFSSKVV